MKAKIYYHDIGDYLTREQKLQKIKEFRSFGNPDMPLTELRPNEHGDWISMRNDNFSAYIPLEPAKKFDKKSKSVFIANSLGTVTARDSWVYNFSKSVLSASIKKTIAHYNSERKLVNSGKQSVVNTNSLLGSWSRDWQNNLKRSKIISENSNEYRITTHRPFVKINSYFDDDLNQERYQIPKLFPNDNFNNLVICVSGIGVNKDFSAIIINKIADYQLLTNGQCFPFYYYEEKKISAQKDLFKKDSKEKYTRRDAVSDFILAEVTKQYGKNISKEDIFYYVYGFLHSKEYRETFANDLKKMLPRLPLVENPKDFWAFSKAGRKLADLHLNYESVPPQKGLAKIFAPLTKKDKQISKGELEYLNYRVEKMRFGKKEITEDGVAKTVDDKSVIIYNPQITIHDIPAKAHEYVVNGKGAIEWIMERYQVKTHKESGIANDPNDWAKEHNDPKYIFNLLLSVINVSVQTANIVDNLPKVKFD